MMDRRSEDQVFPLEICDQSTLTLRNCRAKKDVDAAVEILSRLHGGEDVIEAIINPLGRTGGRNIVDRN